MKTILAIDDSTSVRMLVSYTLQQNGFRVIEAANGAEGLSKIGSEKVDMVITDLNMPTMDGIEFIRSVRGGLRQQFVPIVMLTTESQELLKQEGRAAGATGWIVKPFKPEQLVAVVRKVVG